MSYYSSTPAINFIQNIYAQCPAHVTCINLPKLVAQPFPHASNALVYSGMHGNIQENTQVLSSLAVSDGRVTTCYGCFIPLKIILPRGGKANSNTPFDFVVIAKLHRPFRKDEEIAKSKLNFYERSIKIDAKFRLVLQDIDSPFIQFRLQLDYFCHICKCNHYPF